jgi:hypothetical protein
VGYIILDSIFESVNDLRPPQGRGAFDEHGAGSAHPDSTGDHGAQML